MATGNVLYLPPGVVPPTGPQQATQVVSSGVPFDRVFFERILPQAIGAFCSQTDCNIPRVELMTVDGSSHYVTGIIAVTDIWVSLQVAKEEHDHPIQAFIPYQTIYRVEVHPETERRRHIGFIREPERVASAPMLQVAAEQPAAAPEEVIDATPAVPAKPARRAPRKADGTAEASAPATRAAAKK